MRCEVEGYGLAMSRSNASESGSDGGPWGTLLILGFVAAIGVAMIAAFFVMQAREAPSGQPPGSGASTPTSETPVPTQPIGGGGQNRPLIPQPSMAVGTRFRYEVQGISVEGEYLGVDAQGRPVMRIIDPLTEVSSNAVVTLDQVDRFAEGEIIHSVQTGQHQGWVALPALHRRAPFDPQHVDALECPGGFRYASFGGGILGGICVPQE
jgi:hypothetical protein